MGNSSIFGRNERTKNMQKLFALLQKLEEIIYLVQNN